MNRIFHLRREETNEIADSKISVHDQHRFEIKLDVELHACRSSRYQVTTYFFVPRALNVSPHTYDKHKFYSSSQQYIRFRTPRMSLRMITDDTSENSPFARIKRSLPFLLSGQRDEKRETAVYNEIKLLGAVTRGAIRDFVRHLMEESRQLGKGGVSNLRREQFNEKGRGFVSDIEVYRKAINSLRTELLNPVVPKRIREAFVFFDEFISITIEDFLANLLETVQEQTQGQEKLAVEKDMVAAIRAENDHRQMLGYPSVLGPGTRTSVLPYRRSVLKKFISSSLYLNMQVSEWEGWLQFGFGIAAGLAMFFAAAVTLLAQNRYATNSWPFVLVLVISYIFKDRMKDWLKVFFSRSMVRWISDRKIAIRDPLSGQMIGYLKEAFSFVDYSNVPADVLARRNMDNITSIDEEGKPERVMKYDKEVVLYPRRISRFHERRKDINDIMRLNIRDFVVQADDPTVDYLHLNPQTEVLEHLRCDRVYHLNMVMKYRSSSENQQSFARLDRIRLILNRDGIRSLEEVTGVV